MQTFATFLLPSNSVYMGTEKPSTNTDLCVVITPGIYLLHVFASSLILKNTFPNVAARARL